MYDIYIHTYVFGTSAVVAVPFLMIGVGRCPREAE